MIFMLKEYINFSLSHKKKLTIVFMLHCAHAYHHSMKKIMLHATDIDVLVLAIAKANVLKECEIWIAFRHSKNFRYISAHTIAVELGDD